MVVLATRYALESSSNSPPAPLSPRLTRHFALAGVARDHPRFLARRHRPDVVRHRHRHHTRSLRHRPSAARAPKVEPLGRVARAAAAAVSNGVRSVTSVLGGRSEAGWHCFERATFDLSADELPGDAAHAPKEAGSNTPCGVFQSVIPGLRASPLPLPRGGCGCYRHLPVRRYDGGRYARTDAAAR